MQIEPFALILIAVISTPRDLEIARLLGWYRIPLRTAPKVINVDYIAFYQTGSFKSPEGGAINFIARVRGNELVTRSELFTDEPDHPRSSEEYYKMSIGSLERINPSIKATSWKRVSFLYSTGEYLSKAKTMNDLVVQNEDRSILWRSLRERGSQTGIYQVDDSITEIDPEIFQYLAVLNGKGNLR